MSETNDYINDIENPEENGQIQPESIPEPVTEQENNPPTEEEQVVIIQEEISETVITEEVFEADSEDSEDSEENIPTLKAGEFSGDKEEEKEEIQQLHTKHPRPVPVIDHRLLAGKLAVYDWLSDLPKTDCAPEIVEVRFKNTRKAFFSNPSQLNLQAGDIVAVEAALGHDIGVVSLSGELVKEQIRVKRIDLERNPLKKVYRKAKPHDIEKWQQAIALEHETMRNSRKIAAELNLYMKIGVVD